MDLSFRTRQILTILLGEDKAISVKTLAERIGISKRTVQRELEYLNSDLKNYPVDFKSKTGVGIWLEGTKEDKLKLLKEINGEKSYDVFNKEERRKRLILEILKEKGLKKIFYYSSQFGVSEATISNDLEAIESWLNENKLTIIRKPGSGIVIDGTEEEYRRAIRKFITENIDTNMIKESYETEEYNDNISLGNTDIGKLLNQDILKGVEDTIKAMNDERILTLTESSYAGLVIHIAIAINRILKNEMIEENKELTSAFLQDEDYELSKKIVDKLEKTFNIKIPKMEIYYICLHIKGSKHQTIELVHQSNVELERGEIQSLVNEMIDAFDEQYAFLLKQDNEFIQGLLAHLHPTIIRIMHNMQISNPILEDIKKNYSDIFEKCKRVAKVLEKWLEKEIPETEVGFLTVHFGAAMVRLEDKKENLRQVSVGIVCASGIGISRLMASKIEKSFKDRISIMTYGKNDVTPYIVTNTDFFVSSIPLELDKNIIIYVNPLLNESDMETIRQWVSRYERMPAKKKEPTKFSVQLEQVNFVANQIKQIINNMGFIEVNPNISFEELLTLIAAESSLSNEQRLVIKSDIMKREKLATQIFAEFGFALLHARTKGVIKPQFIVCIPETRENYKDPYFKEIKVAVAMLLPDDEHIKENTDILGYISSSLVEDFTFLNLIFEGDKEKIRASLSSRLKKYFNQYLLKI